MDLDVFLQGVSKSDRNRCFYHFTDARNEESITKRSATRPVTKRKARRPPRQGGVTLPRRHEDGRGLTLYMAPDAPNTTAFERD